MPTIKPIKEKETNIQIYPQTSTEAVVGLSDYVDGKINTAVGQIHTSESTSTPLANFNFANSDQLTEGTYIVTNATNSPFKDEVDGVLKVIDTTPAGSQTTSTIQTWSGRKYTGYREFAEFNPLEAGIESITVNGVKVNTNISDEYTFIGGSATNGIKFTYEQRDTYNGNSGKIMWLYPGGIYEISGVLLDCQIRIGCLDSWYKAGTTQFNATNYDNNYDANYAVTTLKLNNFYQKISAHLEYDLGDESSPEPAISEYQPFIYSDIAGKTNGSTLVIELVAGSKNYLHRIMDENMETWNNKWGVIYTESDLTLKGTGSLGINDGGSNSKLLGGHALKAKGNLLIQGAPHVSARVYHDIIHGNESVTVEGGYFQAIYCNDIFGTDTTRGDDGVGKIRIYNGVFDIRECFGTFVQADDAIIYPHVKVTFNTIGEGLWLQCANGFYKSSSLKGECNGFGIINDVAKTFNFYKFDKKKVNGVKINPDAGAFTEFISANGTSKVNIMYNGEQIEWPVQGDKCLIDEPMGGIIVYEGVTVTPDAEYSYTESARNTHVESLTLETPAPASFNHTFAATPTSTSIANELTVAQANEYTECLIADAHFDAIDFTYNTLTTGGVWNIGITEFGLTEYKNEVNTLLTLLKGMIVPPKSVALAEVKSLDFTLADGSYALAATNTRDDILQAAAEIAKGATYDGQVTSGKIKEGANIYTSATKLEPTVVINVGESVRLVAAMEPDNTTNAVFKWSVAGISEENVIARVKDESTAAGYCDVRGLQVGAEDIILSAKSLDKNNLKLSVPIHIVIKQFYNVYYEDNTLTFDKARYEAGETVTFTFPETNDPSQQMKAYYNEGTTFDNANKVELALASANGTCTATFEMPVGGAYVYKESVNVE